MGNCLCCRQEIAWVAKETFHPLDGLGINEEENLLRINKGDKLKMLDERSDLESDMYLMRNLSTKESGLVSKMFVAKVGTVDCEPWYFGRISRRKAEDLLKISVNIQGSFLVRHSEQYPGDFSLSVKNWSDTKENFEIKHYRIRFSDNRYFITQSHQYLTLDELIKTCQENNQRGIACKLTNICLRPHVNLVETSWNIPRSEIELKEKIGSGNFGSVYKGLFRDLTEVAVKQLHVDPEEGMSSKAKREFMDEAKILKTLHHPNLVQVLGVCIDSDPYLMVLEFLDNGDLRNFLRNDKKKETTYDKLLLISEDIAAGMQELSRIGIVHRDLAARNIMLDKWFQAKVGDFGLAREGGEYSNQKTLFPVRWTAPEALKTRVFTLFSDIWSFGVVLWEIFTFGQVPYSNISSNSKILTFLNNPTNRLQKPDYKGTSSENLQLLYEVMLACWIPEPEERPSMKDLHHSLANFGTGEMKSMYDTYSAYAYIEGKETDQRSQVVNSRAKRQQSEDQNQTQQPVQRQRIVPRQNQPRQSKPTQNVPSQIAPRKSRPAPRTGRPV